MSDFDLDAVYTQAEEEIARIARRKAEIRDLRKALDIEYRGLTETNERAERLLRSRDKRARAAKPKPGQSVNAHAQTAEAVGEANSA